MAASVFDQRLTALKRAAQQQSGLQLTVSLREAMNAFAGLADEERADFKPAVANMLPELASPSGAGFLAVWLGGSVERGANPERSCRQILETFLKWSRTVVTAGVDAGEDPAADEETIAGLQLLGQALVAHLARASSQRRQISETPDIVREIERIEHLSYGAMWVLELLRQRSGELVVLHGTHKIGVVVRYENLSNCFHLFTLLQGALAGIMPDAKETSAGLLAIARGETLGDGHDSAWWHYGPGTASEAAIVASIWGEASPDSIPRIDGRQVMILWPPILSSRSWDTGFFSPVLHACLPSVEVTRVLSAAEVDAWRASLNLPELPV